MKTIDIDKMQQVWTSVTDALFVPHTEDEYNQLVRFLDTVIDEVGEDENHPLASLMEIIGILIERYETDNVAELEF
jgi:HTH-type transcriptional regulator/antitoxin HigA